MCEEEKLRESRCRLLESLIGGRAPSYAEAVRWNALMQKLDEWLAQND